MKKMIFASLFSSVLLLSGTIVPTVTYAESYQSDSVNLSENEGEVKFSEEPEQPEQSGEPEVPEESEQPEQPEEPEVSEEPEQPEESEQTEIPEAPQSTEETEEAPVEPAGPKESTERVKTPDNQLIPSYEKTVSSDEKEQTTKKSKRQEITEKKQEPKQEPKQQTKQRKSKEQSKVESPKQTVYEKEDVEPIQTNKQVNAQPQESSKPDSDETKWVANTSNQIDIEEGDTEYTIQWGDTLWAISEKSGVSIEELAQLNDIENVDLIFAGDVLQLV